MERIGYCMGYEVSKVLNYKETKVETPLGSSRINVMYENVVLIPIMRAAIPLYNGMLEIFDQADSGFIGAFREEEGGGDIEINFGYMATPDLNGKTLMLIDPMLATGKSLIKTLENLKKNGYPIHTHIISVVSAPEGIQRVAEYFGEKPFTIWTLARDEKLNAQKYIVPGLGDAGDLSFGEKL